MSTNRFLGSLRPIARGVAGTAVLWGAAWSLLSLPTVLMLLRPPSSLPASPDVVWSLLRHAVLPPLLYGAGCGGVFALLLAGAFRRYEGFRRLSPQRGALLGAVGAVAVTLAVWPSMWSAMMVGNVALSQVLLPGLLGAVTAGGSVALAHRPQPLSHRLAHGDQRLLK